MRTSLLAGISAAALLASATCAFAAPVELVCKSDRGETHVFVNLDANTVTWFDQVFPAQITDRQVHWVGNQNTDVTLDRDTGTLVARQYSATGRGQVTWACSKPQRLL